MKRLPIRLESIYVGATFIALSGAVFLLFFENARFSSDPQGNTFAQALSAPALLYTIFTAIVRSGAILGAIRRAPLPLLLCLLCIVSTCWSIDPAGTLRRSVLLTGITLFSYSISIRFTPSELVRVLCGAFISMSLLGLAGAALIPGTAIHQDQHYPAVRGFFAQKNIAGRVLLLGIVIGIATTWADRRSRTLGLAAAASCTAGVIASLSATALVDLVVVAAVFAISIVWRKLSKSAAFLVTVIAVVLIPAATYFVYENILLNLIASTGRDITLTGRTLIWAELFSQVREKSSLLGFGYEAFWTADNTGAATTRWIGLGPYIPPQAHNGLIHAFTALGYVGAFLCLYTTAKLILKCISCISSENREFALVGVLGTTFCSYFVVVNITENEFLTYNSVIWCVFVAIYVYANSKPIHRGSEAS